MILSTSIRSLQADEQMMSKALKTKVSKMTLDEKLGQVFVFGFIGKKMSPALKKHIKKTMPGGVIIFQRNISSFEGLHKLNIELQSLSFNYAQALALIMIDQEGGNVSRLKWTPVQPSALALGMHPDSEAVSKLGYHTGMVLRSLGINMNLAPVVDLSDPLQKNFMGNRAFGHDPVRVNEMAFMFANGLSKANVLPTLKHFPGHGGILEDSHKITPTKNVTLQEKERHDLVPFQFFSEVGLPSAMMVAHIAFPQIDPSGRPATFSSVMINELLIKKMGYKGLIVTDDLEMYGAKFLPSIGQRVVEAFKAGNDMMMVGWNPANQLAALKALKEAVKGGEISMARLDQSVEKILKHKELLESDSIMSRSFASVDDELQREINSLVKISNEILLSNLQLSFSRLAHRKGDLTDSDALLVYSSDAAFFTGIKTTPLKDVRLIKLDQSAANSIEKDLKANPNHHALFYVTGQGTARMIENLSEDLKSRIFVINGTFPAAIERPEQYRGVFDIYTLNSNAGKYVADFLFDSKSFTKRASVND